MVIVNAQTNQHAGRVAALVWISVAGLALYGGGLAGALAAPGGKEVWVPPGAPCPSAMKMKRLAAVVAGLLFVAGVTSSLVGQAQALQWCSRSTGSLSATTLRTGSRSTRLLQGKRPDVEPRTRKARDLDRRRHQPRHVGLADAVVDLRVAQGAKIKIVGAVFDLTPLNI
jgi:hypothetical protein